MVGAVRKQLPGVASVSVRDPELRTRTTAEPTRIGFGAALVAEPALLERRVEDMLRFRRRIRSWRGRIQRGHHHGLGGWLRFRPTPDQPGPDRHCAGRQHDKQCGRDEQQYSAFGDPAAPDVGGDHGRHRLRRHRTGSDIVGPLGQQLADETVEAIVGQRRLDRSHALASPSSRRSLSRAARSRDLTVSNGTCRTRAVSSTE